MSLLMIPHLILLDQWKKKYYIEHKNGYPHFRTSRYFVRYYFLYYSSIAEILSTRFAWRPPSNSVCNQMSTISNANP